MRIDVRRRGWKIWFANFDLRCVKFQYCNGHWYFGLSFGHFHRWWIHRPRPTSDITGN